MPDKLQADVPLDTSAEGVEARLIAPEVHDADYLVFRRLGDGQLIVDVGANSGYSAISIWAAGSGATVLSIEALPFHRAALDRIKARYGERFDFRIIGASDRHSDLDFVIPVIDGLGLSSLATAVADLHWPSLSENLLRFGPGADKSGACTVGLLFAHGHAKPLDRILEDDFPLAVRAPIGALKIDVEGLEPEVIAGAVKTLHRHKPMLLIEGARWRPALVASLRSMGYRTAARYGDQLALADGPGQGVNSFFVHRTRLIEYWRSGLLCPGRLSDRGRFLMAYLLPARVPA